MRLTRLFYFVGIWVAILPYLGFPLFFKNILISVTGLGLVYVGLVLRSKSPKTARTHRKKFENFSENIWEDKTKNAGENNSSSDLKGVHPNEEKV